MSTKLMPLPNLVINNPVRHERDKNENNLAHDFNFVNSTVMKTTTMTNFGIVKTAWHQLRWTTVTQHTINYLTTISNLMNASLKVSSYCWINFWASKIPECSHTFCNLFQNDLGMSEQDTNSKFYRRQLVCLVQMRYTCWCSLLSPPHINCTKSPQSNFHFARCQQSLIKDRTGPMWHLPQEMESDR